MTRVLIKTPIPVPFVPDERAPHCVSRVVATSGRAGMFQAGVRLPGGPLWARCLAEAWLADMRSTSAVRDETVSVCA
jgi:hypothetical protein